ncbi:MAG: HlyD family efflux transporter periplasmic adaptor subunit, partial [Treponema sp.]|nr:HlyD family efflux transporter periplasmic adaptor subunit [Treponema sp.]
QLLLEIDPTQLEAEKESLLSKISEENEKLSALYEIKESLSLGNNIIDKDKHYEAYLRYEVWQNNLTKLDNIKVLNKEKYTREKNLPKSMTTVAKLRELEAEYLVSCNNYDDYDISFKHAIESEIIDLETSSKINNARLTQVEDSLLFTKVRAPIDGIIQEISVFNENDWIQSGQDLFNLIPDDEQYTTVKLSIPAKQAGKIENGMKVKMRFPSLPYHEFGGTEGKIITIDPDISHSQNGEAFFLIKTTLENQSLTDKKGKRYPLKVGLQVDARIIITKRTILSFILEKMNLWW